MERTTCKHEHVTLRGRYDVEAETFCGYQCDDCGLILCSREVEPDDLFRDDLPPLDLAANEDAIHALNVKAFPEYAERATMAFMAGTIRK
jgi:hypothetical protein